MTVNSDTHRPRFAVQKIAGWYRIMGPEGACVGQPYSGRKAAQQAAERMQAAADSRAKRGERPCLCCGTTFFSEGIHHRLCGLCRHRGDVGSLGLPARSTAKIRHAARA